MCYGETPFEADQVRRVVHGALKAIKRVIQGGTLIHHVLPAGGPISLRDPDGDWPLEFQAWDVLTAETVVT